MTMVRRTLEQLEQHDDFVNRHIGPSDEDILGMLETLDVPSLDQLIESVVPDSIRNMGALDLAGYQREDAVLASLREIASRNQIKIPIIRYKPH